jgi:hypothetical protein
MKIARLACQMLCAIVAISVVAVSSASATEPLFKPVGAAVTGDSGLAQLIANGGAEKIDCLGSTFTGVIQNSLLLGNGRLRYLNCTSSGSGGSNCPIRSSNTTTEGLIITNTLHGILGLILPSKETGILFLPQGGSIFLTLEENACTVLTKVTGNVAGLVEPVGVSSTTGKVIFEKEAGPGNNQAILDIDLTHGLGLVRPAFVLFSTTATLTQLGLVTFSEATEVT